MLYKAISGMVITALLGGCAVLKDQETQLHHEPVPNLQQPAEQTPVVEQIQLAEQTPLVEQLPPAEQIEKPPTLGVSYDDILTLFRNIDIHFDVEEASPVQGQTRSMGSTDDGLAYLEVIGNQADISQAALMLAIPSDAPEIRVRNAVLCVAMLNYMFPDWEDSSSWFSRTLERLRTTDDISDEIVQGERVLKVVFSSELGMIVLTVTGKGAEYQ